MSEKEESMILVIGDTQDIDNLAYLFPWGKLEKTSCRPGRAVGEIRTYFFIGPKSP